MGKYQLGVFEEIVLLTVGVLFGDAYGVSIKLSIEEKLKRSVSVGALQSALKRLEQKGYISSKEGESTGDRGGRPKRYFQLTAAGKEAIEHAREVRNQLYNEIPKVALDLKFSRS
ncbi:MAG: PadR family transcriptional regulator [Ekhidna sp.]